MLMTHVAFLIILPASCLNVLHLRIADRRGVVLVRLERDGVLEFVRIVS